MLTPDIHMPHCRTCVCHELRKRAGQTKITGDGPVRSSSTRHPPAGFETRINYEVPPCPVQPGRLVRVCVRVPADGSVGAPQRAELPYGNPSRLSFSLPQQLPQHHENSATLLVQTCCFSFFFPFIFFSFLIIIF